jgi:hypothetical protein
MAISIQGKNIEGSAKGLQVDGFPDRCPICHHNVEPIQAGPGHFKGEPTRMEVPFRCPRRECQRLFIATFAENSYNSVLDLRGTAPCAPITPEHPVEIRELSSSFVEIYRQAAHAESLRLMEIAGMGYRKALEFLVKDFAVNRFPDRKMEIKEKLLGKVIDEFIEDSNVKRTAKRATWLGNDETHYVRKWEDKDIRDLKALIQLARNAIDNVLLADHYENEMPQGKK